MNNSEFLDCIKQSFLKFLDTGSRSNEKLKILHSAIANDLSERLGNYFEIKSLGVKNNQEGRIQGRYIDKNVDITVYRNNKILAGIGVKFVMQNYAQNSNNYFENMLGETANIRSNNIPYFQIFIIPKKLPYYKEGGFFEKWEFFNEHHLNKYKILSTDNIEISLHTPTKTLMYIFDLPDFETEITTNQDYKNYYKNHKNLEINTSKVSTENFGDNIIINDYQTFIEKVKHRILSI